MYQIQYNMNFNIKNRNLNSSIKYSNNSVFTNFFRLNPEDIMDMKVYSKYTYDNLEEPLNELVGININDDESEHFSQGNLAILEKYEHSNGYVNYTRSTIIITKIEGDHQLLTRLWYRPVVATYKLHGELMVAGVLPMDLSVEFKDDKWYSAFKEDTITYCIKVNKITAKEAPQQIHIDHNKIYEYEGELYYDKPRLITDIQLPYWCHIEAS